MEKVFVVGSIPSAGGRSHVRWFATKAEAMERYGIAVDIENTIETGLYYGFCGRIR
jgi:hypothetical protein